MTTIKIDERTISTLSSLVSYVSGIGKGNHNLLVFRGEKEDYGKTALNPYVYRDDYIKSEDIIYRESQRFNNIDFDKDKAVFDRLSRIQHYSAPTRLIDVSEDLFSSIYFAIAEKDIGENKKDAEKTVAQKKDAIIYIIEIDKELIKYYDSDAVSVVSNLAKIPLSSKNEKSKEQLIDDIHRYPSIEKFNEQKSAKFLVHEIREEKPHFLNEIDPLHLTSIHFVLPKLTSNRLRSQKGAFLLFGLNREDCTKPIKLLEDDQLVGSTTTVKHPVLKIHKAILKNEHISEMKKELKCLGINKSFIYPEIDKVSEYLSEKYKEISVKIL